MKQAGELCVVLKRKSKVQSTKLEQTKKITLYIESPHSNSLEETQANMYPFTVLPSHRRNDRVCRTLRSTCIHSNAWHLATKRAAATTPTMTWRRRAGHLGLEAWNI